MLLGSAFMDWLENERFDTYAYYVSLFCWFKRIVPYDKGTVYAKRKILGLDPQKKKNLFCFLWTQRKQERMAPIRGVFAQAKAAQGVDK